MTIGTGFVGRSSLSENLEPKHLVNLTRIAYSTDPSEVLPSFAGVVPWAAPAGPVPAYPHASNLAADPSPVHASSEATEEIREELRRLIIEELTTLIKG
jgi:acetaldehyde dehydrogenase / alcohol dehydrogenase